MAWDQDPYSLRAKKEGFVARSIYKLEEIDRKERLFSKAPYVLDLGAAPGSWTQYCLSKKAEIVAVDLLPLQIQSEKVHFYQQSISGLNILELTSDKKFNLVLSDMAPNTSGVHDLDVARSLELCEMALNVAISSLEKGGNFVTKIFMGEGFEEFKKQMNRSFEKVKVHRPKAIKKQSREVYLVGLGLK